MTDISNFACMYGNIIIAIAQYLVHYYHLRSQDWFVENKTIGKNDTFETETMTSHVMFLAITMTFIFSLVALYASTPTKQRFYQNIALLILLIICSVFISIFYLSPNTFGTKTFKLNQVIVDNPSFLGV